MNEVRAVLPSLEHLTMDDFERVYEPAEDTYLFCDALATDESSIVALRPAVCVEIGCGSGCVITYLGQLLKRHQLQSHLLATDVNHNALLATQATTRHNNVHVDLLQCDLVCPLLSRLHGSIDVLLFNPPYVPTDDDEVVGCDISAEWAGGRHGRRVIDRLLPQLQHILSRNGACYMVLVEENRPQQITRVLSQDNLYCEIICKRRAKNELLYIMKITRATHR